MPRLSVIVALIGIFVLTGAACVKVNVQNDEKADASDTSCVRHCVLLRAGEIEAIIGDGSRSRNHPGIWMLTNEHRHFNVFHNRSSAMNGGGLRNRNPVVEQLDETSCVLKKESTEKDPTVIRAKFTAVAPYYLDYELETTDTQDRLGGLGHHSIGFANYTNSPSDIRIHYLSNGEWYAWVPAPYDKDGKFGGPGSSVAPNYVPKEDFEVWPEGWDDPSFWWYKRHDRGFDEPFFYGRFDDQVVIWVFDQPKMLRFFLSPIGGGPSLIPGLTSPAWDFEWIIPKKDYEVGRTYKFRCRIIYKPYEGDEDVLKEVRKTQAELGYETVQKM
ncbi:MAG: hypothetical protein V1794_15735 [Candidatus Glassbacteria bacterium]